MPGSGRSTPAASTGARQDQRREDFVLLEFGDPRLTLTGVQAGRRLGRRRPILGPGRDILRLLLGEGGDHIVPGGLGQGAAVPILGIGGGRGGEGGALRLDPGAGRRFAAIGQLSRGGRKGPGSR